MIFGALLKGLKIWKYGREKEGNFNNELNLSRLRLIFKCLRFAETTRLINTHTDTLKMFVETVHIYRES